MSNNKLPTNKLERQQSNKPATSNKATNQQQATRQQTNNKQGKKPTTNTATSQQQAKGQQIGVSRQHGNNHIFDERLNPLQEVHL
jgi:hypothetical protein